MAKKQSKRKYSLAELENDPSLKYCPYRYGELLRSDTLGGNLVRFVRYEGDRIILADYDAIKELPGSVPILSVRRT